MSAPPAPPTATDAENAAADWEIQPALDWVDNAFGEVEAELSGWRPVAWLKAAFALTPGLRSARAG